MKMKKLLAIVAACMLVAAFGLFGCGQQQAAEEPAPAEDQAAPAEDQAAAAVDYTLLNEGKLTVATSPDFPPFENLDGSEYIGLDMDIMRAVSEKLGLEFNPVSIQFDGIVPAIVAGGQADCAISGITITPDRAEQVDFTLPYYTDDLAIVVMNGSTITEENVDTALNDAAVTIAVQSGTTGADYAKENFSSATFSEYGNANDTFAALQADKAQALVTNKAVAESMLASYTDAVIVKNIATGEEYGIAVSKDNPGLTAAINAALAELEADGTLEVLTAQWMSAAVE